MNRDTDGKLERGVLREGAVRYLAIEAAGAVAIAQERHGLNADGARLLGEAMVAALMMSAYIKGEERLTFQIQCEEPRAGLICDVDAAGGIRARFSPAAVACDGALRGVLLVIKHDASRELYRGATDIRDQGLTAALASHLRQSSQVDAVLRIVIETDDEGAPAAAVGLLLERLPFAADLPSLSAEEFASLYAHLEALPAAELREALRTGQLGEETIAPLETRPVRWRCSCSQERAESLLMALGSEDLRALLEEQGRADVTCHFCNLRYEVSGPRLREILAGMEGEAH